MFTGALPDHVGSQDIALIILIALLQKYQENSRIKVLQIKENGGFSYANNQGYQYAREHFGKSYNVVLNNDIEFTKKDFISRLEQSYQNNQFCMLPYSCV